MVQGKKTVLYPSHTALHAKMDLFGGFLMPIQYEGIIKEHKSARHHAVIFDTCHMGEIRITGETACSDLEKIVTCNVGTLEIGQCRYGFICNEQGGILDDQIIYRIAENKFIMVVNAATQRSDFAWVKGHCSPGTSVTDVSDITGKIDLQGPGSPAVLNGFIDEPVEDLGYFHFTYRYYKNTKLLISRTGYTGEIGFEIFSPHDVAAAIWKVCMEHGALPAGLGCRDTLRLEMGYPLYGQDIDQSHNPAETRYGWAVDRKKTFIGSSSIPGFKEASRHLVGVTLNDRRAARHGDAVYIDERHKIGVVTSGSYSPSLEKAIALAYLEPRYAEPGTRVIIQTVRQNINATVSALPFYTGGSVKKPLSDFLGAQVPKHFEQ